MRCLQVDQMKIAYVHSEIAPFMSHKYTWTHTSSSSDRKWITVITILYIYFQGQINDSHLKKNLNLIALY